MLFGPVVAYARYCQCILLWLLNCYCCSFFSFVYKFFRIRLLFELKQLNTLVPFVFCFYRYLTASFVTLANLSSNVARMTYTMDWTHIIVYTCKILQKDTHITLPTHSHSHSHVCTKMKPKTKQTYIRNFSQIVMFVRTSF